MDSVINNTLEAYKNSDESEAQYGTYITHALEKKSTEDKLFALDFAIKNIALYTIPLSLLQTSGSPSTEFKRISDKEYIRVPNTPRNSGNLDIDESLSFAVIYKALSFLWSGFSLYSAEADAFCASHNDATRDYFLNRSDEDGENGEAKVVFFRYSSDGEDWHTSFIDGDTFMSIKQESGLWSNAIKFVGGGGSGGATTFLELEDTPYSLTAGKFLAVNSAGNGIEEVDAPTGGGSSTGNTDFDELSGSDMVSGEIVIDLLYSSGNKSSHFVYLSGDGTIDISRPDGENYSMELGRVYTLFIFTDGNLGSIVFDALGDTTIDSTAHATILQIVYDGFDIFVLNNKVYTI